MSKVDDPVQILLQETDPLRRARAHWQMGQEALARHDPVNAAVHFEEAFDLDPTDERPRVQLEALRAEPPPTLLRSLLKYLRGGASR